LTIYGFKIRTSTQKCTILYHWDQLTNNNNDKAVTCKNIAYTIVIVRICLYQGGNYDGFYYGTAHISVY